MNILIQPSDPGLMNMGDISMLQIAVIRLKHLFPEASIKVIVNEPSRLPSICPGVAAIHARGQRTWFLAPIFLKQFTRNQATHYLRLLIERQLVVLERAFQKSLPSSIRSFFFSEERKRSMDSFLDAVQTADLLFVTGMGAITDAFPIFTFQLLNTLRLGHQHGAMVIMMGQGVGPLTHPKLRSLAQQVLPLAQLIALREQRASLPLLTSLGVARERIVVTGDDAIELAYPLHTETIGDSIGVNLRKAQSIHICYSGITSKLMEEVRDTLQYIAKAHHAPLVPVPISRGDNDDAKTIQHLLTGYNDSDGGSHVHTPEQVIEQIKQCRVVITGSYHAGVFALSLGIPVVALAKSAYYVDKFLGLAYQFGTGCEVILLDDPDWANQFKTAFERVWSSAEIVKPLLLEAAAKQIEAGHAAYQLAKNQALLQLTRR